MQWKKRALDDGAEAVIGVEIGSGGRIEMRDPEDGHGIGMIVGIGIGTGGEESHCGQGRETGEEEII